MEARLHVCHARLIQRVGVYMGIAGFCAGAGLRAYGNCCSANAQACDMHLPYVTAVRSKNLTVAKACIRGHTYEAVFDANVCKHP